MALPSQNVGAARTRSNMYRRSNRGRLRFAAGVVGAAAVTGAVIWWFWPGRMPAPTPEQIATGDPNAAADADRSPVALVLGPSGESAGDARSTTGGGSASSPAATPERTFGGTAPPNDRMVIEPDAAAARAESEARRAADADAERIRRQNDSRARDAAAAARRNDREGTTTAPPATPDLNPPRQPVNTTSTADQIAAVHEAQAGIDLIPNDPVAARLALSRLLDSGRLRAQDADFVRGQLANLADRMVFSPEVFRGDPYSVEHRLQDGEYLSTLPRKHGWKVEWELIARINGISNPNRIRQGQRMKIPTGPFHVVVDKTDYRMDVWMGDPSDPVYVRSYPVGLGEFNKTPTGTFRVRARSKLRDPEWTNPLTGERFDASNPDNPIGEFWIGIEGAEPHLADINGYGIHGTIDPASIGKQRSMGCVRMLNDDVERIYELLVRPESVIVIRD
ncbi:MAG: L,D-transpeptidase family protein [Phycisphaerales bacterium]